ncbi:MAG: hypothetical protein A2W29_01740 [Gemmatimonadetes bacterium RBG_16_66_8]|nr:MAG: hypothetical protein A2W29_01740 [Gemmatimonadetes bacterium RBG_16_66_8]
MTLADWAARGWITPHATAVQEIHDLLAASQRDLADARKDLSPDWRFVIAYHAALRLCSAALLATGFRAAREQLHYRTIAALPLVVGPTAGELTGFLDHCRRKRHEIAYGTRSAVSPGEVEELIASVDELDGRVRTWLRRRHAGLNA